MPPVDTTRVVETPEGVELLLRPAGPVARALALFLDQLLVWLGMAIAFIGLAPLGPVGLGLGLVLFFLAQWLYPVVFEAGRSGQTPGKRMVGLRVLMRDGRPVGWGPSLIRNLLRVVDALPGAYTVGLVSVLLSPDFQRLGDLVAGTLVVHVEPRTGPQDLPEAEALAPPQPLGQEERAALLAFAERSPRLSPARAQELGDILEPLTEATGETGLRRLLGMARFVRGQK